MMRLSLPVLFLLSIVPAALPGQEASPPVAIPFYTPPASPDVSLLPSPGGSLPPLTAPQPSPFSLSWISGTSLPLSGYVDSSLFPFYHGVASGDPLSDRVILWTRVSPERLGPVGAIGVEWSVALDPEMQEIVTRGIATTGPERDYTVKVDASGLRSGSTYYYCFRALGRNSVVGRTRTTPTADVDHLRFAVASCANYQHGYFNAYARIAERNDLDAVLFLGDYLYEYGRDNDSYGPVAGREHEPAGELVTLEDYRKRHSFYKLDPDLRRLHQQHPFIAIWDDHEASDDCHAEGGRHHCDEKQGAWGKRRDGALQAYFEWMPVREISKEEPRRIYRSFRYGDLAEVILLDSRHEARTPQVDDGRDPELFATDRTMLGDTQLSWFLDRLERSDARWKIVGNQVVMGHLRGVTNLDAWDGYPVERSHILGWIARKKIDNVVFATGDVHVSVAVDLSLNPFSPKHYEARTGAGSISVEFTAPSIASANMNELRECAPRTPLTVVAEGGLKLLNRHVKLLEVDSHGYFVLDVTPERTQADWYHVATIDARTTRESWYGSWLTRSGRNRLEEIDRPARPGHAVKPAPPGPLPNIPAVAQAFSADSLHR